jgi:hypothetical protein
MSKKTRRKKLERLTGKVVPVRTGGPPPSKLRAEGGAPTGMGPDLARTLAERRDLFQKHADELMTAAELAAVVAQELQGDLCAEAPAPYEHEFPDDGSDPIPAACLVIPHDEATTHRLLAELAAAKDWHLQPWWCVGEEAEGEESMYPEVDPSVTSYTGMRFHFLQSAELVIGRLEGGTRIRISLSD